MKNKIFLKFFDPDFCLQKKLRERALGTYFHSLNVGQMAFFAAQKLTGIDPKVVLLAGIYHDAGKIFKPDCFLENKMHGESTTISEEVGKVIADHPKRGAKLAKEYKIPREIRRFILSHHGDAYPLGEKKHRRVYKKVRRYSGPKPMKKDEALIMLADSCEAATRSLDDSSVTIKTVKELVESVFQKKEAEKQFQEIKFSTKEKEIIKENFAIFLSNFYHRR